MLRWRLRTGLVQPPLNDLLPGRDPGPFGGRVAEETIEGSCKRWPADDTGVKSHAHDGRSRTGVLEVEIKGANKMAGERSSRRILGHQGGIIGVASIRQYRQANTVIGGSPMREVVVEAVRLVEESFSDKRAASPGIKSVLGIPACGPCTRQRLDGIPGSDNAVPFGVDAESAMALPVIAMVRYLVSPFHQGRSNSRHCLEGCRTTEGCRPDLMAVQDAKESPDARPRSVVKGRPLPARGLLFGPFLHIDDQ